MSGQERVIIGTLTASSPVLGSVRSSGNLFGNLFLPPAYKQQYVTLEMFGGRGDGETINDEAFDAAVRSGMDVSLESGGVYKFSGDVIDLSDVGRRLLIEGNGAKVNGLRFKYNIGSDNKPTETSGVRRFNVCFRDVYFTNTSAPIMISCSQVCVERCNFSHCDYCFGFPEQYIDYFHAEDCYFYQTPNFISPFNHDGTAAEKGMYGDWITFDRCSFERTTLVYESSLGHSSTVTVRNCLHGVFKVVQSTAIGRSYFIFEGCHAENRGTDSALVEVPLTSGGGMPTVPSFRAVTLRDTFLYSESLPDRLDGITMERCTVNYGNNHNYKAFKCERGSYERTNIYGIVWYDESEFDSQARKATEPTANGWSSVSDSSNTNNLQGYETVSTVKYTFATSLEYDRLYFNGQTKTLTWSSDFTTTIGKCPVFQTSSAVNRSQIRNVYMHVYKVMDGVTYKCVIPTTALIRPNDRIGTYSDGVYFADEPGGIWGCPWEVYTGTVEYETE